MSEAIRNELVRRCRSLFERGFASGTAGNVSVRAGEVVLITPTNSSLGELEPEAIAVIGMDGQAQSEAKPSKEWPFHLAVYRARPDLKAVVHLHSTYATAVSCLRDVDVRDAMPVLTPYYAMRLPCLEVAPYLPPGDPGLAGEVASRIVKSNALLLRNHGSIAAGESLFTACALAEEIEEQAKLFMILGERGRPLSENEVAELRRRFK